MTRPTVPCTACDDDGRQRDQYGADYTCLVCHGTTKVPDPLVTENRLLKAQLRALAARLDRCRMCGLTGDRPDLTKWRAWRRDEPEVIQ